MEDIDPSALARSLGQIPLFREIQRILAAQTGPVNWEMAHQIAAAVAGAEGESAPSVKEIEGIRNACRTAELRVAAQTGMDPVGFTEVKVMTRPEWAAANLEGFRPLIDRLALRLRGTNISSAGSNPLQALFDAIGPFLLGIQVGFLAGYLSRRVLGQYDVCFPTGEPGHLYFVMPNIVAVEQELGVDPTQFRMWLALHEVTHQSEFQSISWTRPYFFSLVGRYVDSAELDSDEVGQKLQGIGDPEQLSRLLEHPEELLPLMMTPDQKTVVDEIQAFMSVLEGYAEWVMNQEGKKLLPDFDRMREGMNRRRAETSPVERLLEKLLGLDLKREQYRAGERFVRAVADAEQLERLWKGAENLPTLEEVSSPSKWVSRVAFGV